MEESDKFHIYASSIAQWMTTTPTRDLREVIRMMELDKRHYQLWYVPLPHNSTYSIRCYAPMVDGVIFLGNYPVKQKNKL